MEKKQRSIDWFDERITELLDEMGYDHDDDAFIVRYSEILVEAQEMHNEETVQFAFETSPITPKNSDEEDVLIEKLNNEYQKKFEVEDWEKEY